MRYRHLLIGVAAAALAAACGEQDGEGMPPAGAPVAGNGQPSSGEPEPPGGPAGEPGTPGAGDAPGAPAPPRDAFADFDRDEARAEAEALLGRSEAAIEQGPDQRIVRRGDEEFAVTMDLRPGRRNIELDEDDSGRYVVTRVVVETPAGEDRIIVE